MILAITIISILGITGFFWLANKILLVQICPICAGVSGTWLWILVGLYIGILDVGSPSALSSGPMGWQLVAGVLMGGSVAGIAYQLEKRMHEESAGWRTPLFWKTLFIPAGFAFAYGVLMQLPGILFASSAFLLLISFIFLFPQRKAVGRSRTVEELEKKMEDCC